MTKWRYVAIDVDGTLLDDQDHFAADRLNRDVQQLATRGVMFIVASGNSYDALQTIFHPCPAVQNFVAENGGRIIVNGKESFSQPHERKTIANLLDYVNGIVPQPDLLSLSGARQTFIAERFRDVPVPYYPHHAYFSRLADVNEPIYNLNLNWYLHHPPLAWIHNLVRQINRHFPKVHATYSGAWGIDILPAGVDKAVSLTQLIHSTGGEMHELVAFGDTSNDQEMIAEAGCGYAMKNATPDLLELADRTTQYDNNHDGLLREIEQLFQLK
ncbi:HAD-IIB family hydrolase [Limosilactobacillus sp.]|jgi:Cof subfamily protein (haloacid dehalogenase superfamily)|uniref:HAD-IIB family hydrolase n=1 Tax=Limosilactobacillus sp. TaxID=2773925 RepID=UPI0025B91600|nr:HAD family hydrolase [Limosilactobacillus sp.]MCH3922799.1 Cof-type HAD-IIB family hydrolase [Limosilactobacillus sp.]MCH3927482.1 Cof-type HAD-IIB family hydrolase [Limosilactobacillus sp.]